MTKKTGVREKVQIFGLVIAILSMICVIIITTPLSTIIFGESCKGSVGDSDELYYHRDYSMSSNLSYALNVFDCSIGNSTLDSIVWERAKERQAEVNRKAEERLRCYEAGRDLNFSFDLINDYNLSCNKIKYINDHFLLSSERKDGGSIKGYYSGFLSHGRIEGVLYDWVNTEILATGMLIKEMNYHLNCDNSTLLWSDGSDTKRVSYYDEADFIMYYVEGCVE